MADSDSGGLLAGAKDLLNNPPWILELLAGGALGAAQAAGGGTVDTSDYWAARGRSHQHRALGALWRQLHPDQPMPAGVESVQDVQAFSPTRQLLPGGRGMIEMPSDLMPGSHEPKVTPFSGIPQPAAKFGTAEERGMAAQMYYEQTGQAPGADTDLTGYMGAARDRLLTDKRKAKRGDIEYSHNLTLKDRRPEKPTFIPSGATAYMKPDGTIAPIPPQFLQEKDKRLTGEAGQMAMALAQKHLKRMPSTEEALRYLPLAQRRLLRWKKTPAAGANEPKDLNTSLAADQKKGIAWRRPDGTQLSAQDAKTNKDALALGAVPLSKDDNAKFKQYEKIEQSATEMLEMLPTVQAALGTKQWNNLAARAVGNKLRQVDMESAAKQNPALAKYLQRMVTLSLNLTKQALPVGRIPVWDQQMLMGLFVAPGMTAETQRSQLQDILESGRGSKLSLLGDAAHGASGQVPAVLQGGGLQPGEIKVRRKADGQIGALQEQEFDPAQYDRVP